MPRFEERPWARCQWLPCYVFSELQNREILHIPLSVWIRARGFLSLTCFHLRSFPRSADIPRLKHRYELIGLSRDFPDLTGLRCHKSHYRINHEHVPSSLENQHKGVVELLHACGNLIPHSSPFTPNSEIWPDHLIMQGSDSCLGLFQAKQQGLAPSWLILLAQLVRCQSQGMKNG